jgi:NADPH:quinone reductase-like Zn-dependent oxidoreductase
MSSVRLCERDAATNSNAGVQERLRAGRHGLTPLRPHMFCVYASAPNHDDPLAALVVGEQPPPEPRAGWVPVRVDAASLNMHDIWTLRGVGIAKDQFPMILGCDGVGKLTDGTEVVIHSIVNAPGWRGEETLDPQRTLLTEKYQGTFAEVVLVPEDNVIVKPHGVATIHAAVMGTAWLTAYRMLFVKSGLRPGQRMLIQGASGGVSTALIQLGRAAGMTVWVTGRTEEKLALAERLGAHEIFETGGRLPDRVDVVFETIGEATWSHSMRAVCPGGAVICSGATTGPHADAELQRLFFLQIRVEGSTMGTRRELVDLLQFVEAASIQPQVGQVLPMEDAEVGFRSMLEGKTAGKIVFTR